MLNLDMDVLYIFHQSGIEGKANIDIFTPAKELVKRGHNFYLISRADCRPYEIKNKEGAIVVYPMLHNQIFLSYLLIPLYLFKLWRIARENCPDIIISSGDWCVPILGFIISRMLKLPLIIVFRGLPLEIVYYNKKANLFVRAGSLLLLKINFFIFRKVKHLVGISPGIRFFYKTILGRDVRLINLECVNVEEFKPSAEARLLYRKKFGIDDDEVVILYSGNIEPYRRLDALVYAFSSLKKRHPNIRLIICGYGSAKEDLIKKIRDLGLSESVIFFNWLPREEMPKLIAMADICVDTYPRSDWPRCLTPSDKLLEYMSCGKCVVTTDAFGHAVLIKDGVNGLLYSPGQAGERLADKIELLLKNRKLIEVFGKKARLTIESKYDVRKIAPAFEKAIFQAISHG